MPLNPKYHPSLAVRFLILSFLQLNSKEGRLIAVILQSDHSCSGRDGPDARWHLGALIVIYVKNAAVA